MIRSFEVKLNAAHPELPLFEATAIVGSASTAFIRRVPASVGSWHITKVYVNAQYPDNTNVTVEAQVGAEGIWTATLPATETSGRVRSGFSILADGIDENGDPITQYILGIADFAVYTRDLKVQPGSKSWVLKYFDVVPDPAKKGDVAKIDDAIKLYDGTEWVAFGSDVDLSNYYTKQETDALFDNYYTKVETNAAIDRLAAYYITYTAAGAAFPTHAALLNAETYYSGGVARTPTRNDYAVVLADETHGGAEYRYIYAVADGQTTGQWEAQYPIETNDYMALESKPQINNVELSGNKSASDLGLATSEQGAKADAALPKSDVVAPSTSAAAGTAADAKDTGDALAGKVSKAGDTMTGDLVVPTLSVGARVPDGAVGANSFVQGSLNLASGQYSFASGYLNSASGNRAHAEGGEATASAEYTHAEGFHCSATATYAHAEGNDTGAFGIASHSEGEISYAKGEASHAEGYNCVAENQGEHAEGRLNVSHKASATWGDAGNTLSSTGFGFVGESAVHRNARETMQDGKTYIYGIGGYDGTNPNTTGVKDLATAVNDKVDKTVPAAAGNIATLTATGGLADSGVDVATALRYALGETITATATLADRTMNKVEPLADNTADIKLSFPAATTGKARDFLVLIINPTGNTGAITFDPPGGATIYGDGLTQTFAAGETWEVTITEVATKQFLCKALKVEGVQVPWTTKFEVTPRGSYLTTGIRSATAIDSTTPTIVDWGDGNTDSITGDISELTHTYSAAGTYVVTISDNISDFKLAGNNGGNWGNNQQIVTKILTISPNVTSLPSMALYGMQQLHYVYAGESGNLTLGGMAFYACGLYASDVGTFDFSGRTIATIPDQCFSQCPKMATFAFPKGVTIIAQSAFRGCFSEAVTAGATLVIPEGVTTIGTFAFWECSYLAEITLPSTVTSFGQSVFHTCPRLGTIRANMMTAVSGNNMFGGQAGEYTGENTAAAGTNRLYVRTGATGYDTGLWLDPLQNAEKCGFTKVEV